MIHGLNGDIEQLGERYLFAEAERRVAKFRASHPGAELVRLGIGDVTLPLPEVVVRALVRGAEALGDPEKFVGYGDSMGDISLRRAICERYARRGVDLNENEIFVNDGAKGDLGSICELFEVGGTSLIVDPSYPVYFDASVMAHRKIFSLEARAEDGYIPLPHGIPREPMLIYLCSPSNPTGTVIPRDALGEWVEFAILSGSAIVFDAAYEAYISDASLPHSIFEIPGAEKCAVEVCSLSKSAGFTGLRCGWCAISEKSPLHALWARRRSARFNGACRLTECGALAALSPEGEAACRERIDYYMAGAKILASALTSRKISYVGGLHAPYLWVDCPDGSDSWEAFDALLERVGVISTPGVGFGASGEGHLRLSSFAPHEEIQRGAERILSFF